MKNYDISDEAYRSYRVFLKPKDTPYFKEVYSVVIKTPKTLYWEPGHQFHRVWNGKYVTLAPAPGPIFDDNKNIIGWVEMTWEPFDCDNPCAF